MIGPVRLPPPFKPQVGLKAASSTCPTGKSLTVQLSSVQSSMRLVENKYIMWSEFGAGSTHCSKISEKKHCNQ